MKLPIQPRLKANFEYSIIEPDGVFLIGEQSHHVLKDIAFVKIIPLLDGTRTVGDILAETKLNPVRIFSLLTQLLQLGCLVENNNQPQIANQAYWDYWNVAADKVQSVQKLPLQIKTIGNINAQEWKEKLQENGFTIADNGVYTIVLTDDYLNPELESLNKQYLEEKHPWILVKPQGMILWIGPVFRPGYTACWECLAKKLRVNRQVEEFITHFDPNQKEFHYSKTKFSLAESIGMNLAIIELTKSLLAPAKLGLENKILTLDLVTLQFQEHIVVQRPQCSVCGNPNVMTPQPIELHSCKKVHPVEQYGHRSATHEETYNKYKHLVSPISGIITSLNLRTENPYERSYNYTAGHYFPSIPENIRLLRTNLFSRSGAHGHTDVEAKTSAIAETIERYSGIYWGEEKYIVKSYNEIKDNAYSIKQLGLYSEAQYKNRIELNNTATSEQQYIPEFVDDDTPIAWSQAWSLTHNRFQYVPTAYSFYNFREAGNHFYSAGDSNGCASGNTMEEAILQGLLEIVERDAAAMWWYNRYQCPLVDGASFNLPYWYEMQKLYAQKLERDLFVIDITSDWNIPTFVAISHRINHPIEEITVGLGSHLDPKRALLRALEEINQTLPALERRDKDGNTIYYNITKETSDWLTKATYENQPYLLPNKNIPPKTYKDFSCPVSDDIKDDLEFCLDTAKKLGLEVLVVNQTRPDINMPVVKVIVPGMRHFWRRLAPGRLYDVPVTLGKIPAPLTEQELNPIACFV
jgi:ribosomal protein S12 methylthiotransferase accessory factor